MSRVEISWLTTASLDPRALAASAALLDADERARHDGFVFEKNKREYLATRGLERAVLARASGRRPDQLGFRRTPLGRPELVEAGDLRFNLTNTVELVAIAVTFGREIGIDAEPIGRAAQVLDVAPTVFTEAERAALSALEGPARAARAVTLWTLKEAYIKARGLGFSLPVQEFEITDDDRLRFAPSIDDDPARWRLSTHRFRDHVVSLCVEGTCEIVAREIDIGSLLAV